MAKNTGRSNYKDEPSNVTVMGEEVVSGRRHRESRDTVWGMFLIFAGGLLLLNTIGIIPWQVWNELIRFWPLLLILGGLRILLGSSTVSHVVMAVLTFLFFGFAILAAVRITVPELLPALPTELENLIMYWEEVRR